MRFKQDYFFYVLVTLTIIGAYLVFKREGETTTAPQSKPSLPLKKKPLAKIPKSPKSTSGSVPKFTHTPAPKSLGLGKQGFVQKYDSLEYKALTPAQLALLYDFLRGETVTKDIYKKYTGAGFGEVVQNETFSTEFFGNLVENFLVTGIVGQDQCPDGFLQVVNKNQTEKGKKNLPGKNNPTWDIIEDLDQNFFRYSLKQCFPNLAKDAGV